MEHPPFYEWKEYIYIYVYEDLYGNDEIYRENYMENHMPQIDGNLMEVSMM